MSHEASSRAVRRGDLATLTGFVVAEAIALRAAAPGCAHWAQHAAAAATVLPLLAGSAGDGVVGAGCFFGNVVGRVAGWRIDGRAGVGSGGQA